MNEMDDRLEEYNKMIGRYIKYTGYDPYILQQRTRLGVVIEYYTVDRYDEDDEYEDNVYEVLVLGVKINNQNFELEEDDLEFLSPEAVEVFQDQEKREAHADKYL